jgi:hypothetical protein
MMKFVGIMGVMLVFLSSTALAGYDGNKLYRLCEEAPPLAGMCIQGVVDTNG